MVSLEGCDYRINKEDIETGLGHWGELVSDLRETTFDDPLDPDGTNRTGIYCVEMKLTKKIPQIIPLCGRRVKVDYTNVQKLCTKCFGPHFRSKCKVTSKTSWSDYVVDFLEKNPGLPSHLFGMNYDQNKEAEPTEEQF